MLLNHGGLGDHGVGTPLIQSAPAGQYNFIADRIFDTALKIHKQYGPGLLESAYEAILFFELSQREKLRVERQKTLPLIHEGLFIEAGYRIDLLVDDEVIVKLKACEKILPIHEAQVLTYLKLSQKRLGIILNFNSRLMKDGMKRLML
jgi:GxxExxY protein